MNLLLRVGAVAAALALSAPAFAADLKIGVISSMSGPVSGLGIPYAKGIEAALAQHPLAGGRKVQVIMLDDASDPAVAARDARKLVAEDKVDALIGTSGVPGAMAIAAVARETHTPLLSPTPINLPPGQGDWAVCITQPFPLMVAAVVGHMKAEGVKTVGYIGFSDALGDLVYSSLEKAAGPAGIRIVAGERYARSDTSIAGQVLKLVAAHPDAILAGNSGSPGALPYLGLAQRGYKGGLYGTHGLINADFVRVAGASANGLIVPSGPVMVAEQLPATNPVRKVALEFEAAYRKKEGALPTDAFSAYTYDAYLVFADAAARALKSGAVEPGTAPFRAALQAAIGTTHELVGTHGIYNFKPGEAYGLDQRSIVLIRLEKGQWKLVH